MHPLLLVFKHVQISWLELPRLAAVPTLHELLQLGEPCEYLIHCLCIRSTSCAVSFSLCLLPCRLICQQVSYHRAQLDDLLSEGDHEAVHLRLRLRFVLRLADDLPCLREPRIEEFFDDSHLVDAFPADHVRPELVGEGDRLHGTELLR